MPAKKGLYEKETQEAIMTFWGNREKARQKAEELHSGDQGTRSSVTAGKNLDGFIVMIRNLINACDKDGLTLQTGKEINILPGHFRPNKNWDIVVVSRGKLVAAIELKSQVGSFGKNFNNRAEEAIGAAHDFWAVFRKTYPDDYAGPFLGWLMVVEDAEQSRAPVSITTNDLFPAEKEFFNSSYIHRYKILCERLVNKQLYSAACLLATPQDAEKTGAYRELSRITSIAHFMRTLLSHLRKTLNKSANP